MELKVKGGTQPEGTWLVALPKKDPAIALGGTGEFSLMYSWVVA